MRLNLRRLIKAIEEDPAQYRASLIPCSCVVMAATTLLLAFLFPYIAYFLSHR